MADVPEPLVDGRFRLCGLLGSGGTASVFEAVDTASGDVVALKLLHPHLAAEPELRAAFLREAEVVTDVTHSALCRPVAAGAAELPEPIAWTAWELAPGATLSEHVRARGVLTPAAVVEVATSVLGGLSALHASGLVHRDISPGNVVVSWVGGRIDSVKIVDFGLIDVPGANARGSDVLLSRRTADGEGGVVGNVAYASPEQLRGDAVDAATDIYQLAGVMYFLLVGEPPFVRPSTAEVIRAHQSSVPPTASVRARATPVALDRVIVRGLMKERSARFGDADEMAAAIGDTAALRPIDAPTAPTRAYASPPPSTAAEDLDPYADGDQSTPRRSVWLMVAVAVVAIVAAGLAASAIFGAPNTVVHATAAPTATTPISTPTEIAPPTAPSAPQRLPIAVPDTVGLYLDDARAALTAAGLGAGEVREEDAPRLAGVVLRSDPAVGAVVEAGIAVGLAVSTGWTTVPVTNGLDVEEATRVLGDAGFATNVTNGFSTAAPGTVIGSTPAADTRSTVGTVVTIVVSEGASPATPSPTPTMPSATPTGAP